MKNSALFCIIAAAMAIIWGCSTNADSDSTNTVQDTIPDLLSKAEADTLAHSIGFIQGSDVNYEKQEMILLDSAMTAFADSSYLRGFETAIGPDIAARGYTQGVRAAREIIFKIEDLKAYGVEIDRELLLAALERQFAADTITSEQLQSLNNIYNQLLKDIYSQPTQ